MQVFHRPVSARRATVFAFELVLVSGSVALAAELHGNGGSPLLLWHIALITAICQLSFYYNNLYDLALVQTDRDLVVRLLRASGAATIALAVTSVIAPSMMIDASTFVTATGVFVGAMITWRLTFRHFTRDPRLEERVLILGSGHVAQMLAREVRLQQDYPYRVIGFVDDRHAPVATNEQIFGSHDIPRLIQERRVDRIVVSLSDRRGRLPTDELLRAKLSGIRIEDVSTTYERLTGKILVDDLKPSALIFSDGFRASHHTRAVKRALDLGVAAIGLVVGAPLMAITAFAVRFDSPGPVLYSQERVGEDGVMFTLYKFRSMRVDAEQDGPVWANDRDDRVTRVGRFIRLTRLDELPQLWNVIRGDMSFVGPRPERPFFVEQLAAAIPFYIERHSVKPGITGWAQVKYRYGASVDDAMEKLRYDLYYIKHLSIVFDLTIFLDTLKVIVSRQGAQ